MPPQATASGAIITCTVAPDYQVCAGSVAEKHFCFRVLLTESKNDGFLSKKQEACV